MVLGHKAVHMQIWRLNFRQLLFPELFLNLSQRNCLSLGLIYGNCCWRTGGLFEWQFGSLSYRRASIRRSCLIIVLLLLCFLSVRWGRRDGSVKGRPDHLAPHGSDDHPVLLILLLLAPLAHCSQIKVELSDLTATLFANLRIKTLVALRALHRLSWKLSFAQWGQHRCRLRDRVHIHECQLAGLLVYLLAGFRVLENF